MPTATYDLIASTTLAASTSSVVFGSLPQTYRDLVLIVNGLATAAPGIVGRLNGDSGANYSTVRMFGTGSGSGTSDTAGGLNTAFAIGVGSSSTINSQIVQVMDYSATDKHKTMLTRNSASAQAVNAHAARWANTAAVTSITISTESDAFASGATFNLYGIAS